MPPSRYKHLPAESVCQLAVLLQFAPGEMGPDYRKRLKKTLSDHLKHRSKIQHIISMERSSPIDEVKPCILHKHLSSALIHEIFTLLSLEVGYNSNSLIAHNSWLRPQQFESILKLRDLHSLWLKPEAYEMTFLLQPSEKWPYVKSGCEGCILTEIGSDIQTILDLRILLLSRRRITKPQKGHPRLLSLVDGWIAGLVSKDDQRQELMRGTEMAGEELKIIRKRIWRERKEQKIQRKKALREGATHKTDPRDVKESGEVDEGAAATLFEPVEAETDAEAERLREDIYNSDFEDAIIDHYRALRSTLVRSSPAQQPSLTERPETVPFRVDSFSTSYETNHPLPSPPLPLPSTAMPLDASRPKSSSIYSFHGSNEPSSQEYVPPRRDKAWQDPNAIAAARAQTYRQLHGWSPTEARNANEKTLRPIEVRPLGSSELRSVVRARSASGAADSSSSSASTSTYYQIKDSTKAPAAPGAGQVVATMRVEPLKKGKRETRWSQFC